jgi:phage terminase large subunit GpA-like protein
MMKVSQASTEQNSLGNAVERLFLGRLFQLLEPVERISTREYAETYRWLTTEVTAKPGLMDCMETPFMLFVMECMDDIDIPIIVARKSAQIAWSETQNSYIAKRMDIDPQNIIMAFPRQASSKSYANEKIRPLIKSVPSILQKVGDPDKCSYDFYKYPGGFLKLVTAGSPTALKSTSAPVLIVEEPDDLKEDLKGQGDALTIFAERQKTYLERKLIYGGTPSEVGFSKVDSAFLQSNQMFYHVPCPFCGQEHVLDFNNLKYDTYADGRIDPTYGKYDPTTAYYECPHCKAIWDDAIKKAAVLDAINYNNLGWKATAESTIYGFAFNELLSSFPGSNLVALAKKKLEAEVENEKGKDGKLKAFTNNSCGLAYSPGIFSLNAGMLAASRLGYSEGTVEPGGIILTAGVDVQHNRFAIVIRAWGRNGNSWLVYWGEVYGFVKDPEDPVWAALTEIFLAKYPHAFSTPQYPVNLPISALSIDSGDGNTTQLVYDWVRRMKRYNKHVYATKGSSDAGAHSKEIFTVPQAPDAKTAKEKNKKLAESHGVGVYIVGVQAGKDEVLRKLTLSGNKDRMYYYDGVRADYDEQILSNKKRRSATSGAVRYELVAGKRDEALDCEVLALHASRSLFLHLWTEKHWKQAETMLSAASVLQSATSSNVTPGIN